MLKQQQKLRVTIVVLGPQNLATRSTLPALSIVCYKTSTERLTFVRILVYVLSKDASRATARISKRYGRVAWQACRRFTLKYSSQVVHVNVKCTTC